ncbi:MAG: cation transporter [Bacilli bacterium]|nr:cation transporter [Bacilli bacterium]
MKSHKNILIAFLLNLFFSIFELIGGIFTKSVAIISDSIHDIGDACSIGVSFFLEKKSKRKPDSKYTYGYSRYSVIGSVITVLILLVGSFIVIYNAILRIINPVDINYDGMIIFAIVGVLVNLLAAFVTHKGESLNQKAVSLHMIEDVLGWAVVLIGAIVIKFTNFVIIDPILSICVAIYIIIHAFSHLKEALDLFLEKTPENIDLEEIKHHLLEIEGIKGVHHIHVWSMDGINNYATMHVVTNFPTHELKHEIKEELNEHGINHVTIEFESEDEVCDSHECVVNHSGNHHHHHHHH